MPTKDYIKYKPNIPNVKGLITIQLLKDNKIIKEVKQHNAASILTRPLCSYISSLLGSGRLLLDRPVYFQEDHSVSILSQPIVLECFSTSETSVVENKLFMPYTRLGYAILDSVYTGSSIYEGSINSSESDILSVDDTHIKVHIVVDFPTQACNGTFNAIQLSPWVCHRYGAEAQSVIRNIFEDHKSTLFSTPFAENQGYGDVLFTVYQKDLASANLPTQIQYYTKFFSQDQSSIWFICNSGPGFTFRISLNNKNTILESHSIHYSDGTTSFQKSLTLDEGDYLSGYFYNSADDSYKVYKVAKSTWNANVDYNSDSSSIVWPISVPNSRFAINGLTWYNESTGNCSNLGERYFFGYTQETINNVTVYHYSLYILDAELNITKRIFIGDTNVKQSSRGVISLKDYFIIANAVGNSGQCLIIRKSDDTVVGSCFVYDDIGGILGYEQNYTYPVPYESTSETYQIGQCFSHSIDNNLHCLFSYSSNGYRPYMYSLATLFPYTFLNRAILPSPVTKTSLNTMKIQYDLTLEIPNPTITV